MDVSARMTAVVRAKGGDEEAFASLVQTHSRRVFQLAYRMMRNEQDAEDVVQESFLRAYRQLGRFEARADFGTWLYRITANCAIDRLRSERQRSGRQREPLDVRAETFVSPVPGPDRLAASAQLEQLLTEALSSLTVVERAAFTLRHYEGRSIDEICGLLHLGKSAAKHAVFRAVRKLRLSLGPITATSTPRTVIRS